MNQSGAKRATAILGIVMIIAIGGSAILPLFTNNNIVQTSVPPTAVPTATFPAPIADLTTLSFGQSFLHPTGLFSVAQPNGWTPNTPVTNVDGAEVSMNNPEQLSVIQVSLRDSAEPIASLDALDAQYTAASLNESWSNYRRDATTGLNYRETKRERQDDRLIIDFELENQRNQIFLARQVSWFEGDWVYSLRVVTPENAIEELLYIMDQMLPTFKANTQFRGTPVDWQAYFDPDTGFIIRYPSIWNLEDSAPGRPASIIGDGVALRVEFQPGVSVADEAAAGEWVTNARPGATIVSTAPATRGDVSGFSVAYSFTDADGAPNSGLALLLNGANGLHVANLRFARPNVDLNAEEAAATNGDLLQVLQTFSPLTGISLFVATPTPSPTPLATATPEATVEVTEAATEEATEAATAEATSESTPEAEATEAATAEATEAS